MWKDVLATAYHLAYWSRFYCNLGVLNCYKSCGHIFHLKVTSGMLAASLAVSLDILESEDQLINH